MDRRLQGRIDPSDVLQETFLEAARRVVDFARDPTTSVYLWLRFLTGQKLVDLARRHLGSKMRDAGLEISIYRGSLPQASSVSLAAQLLGRFTSPSRAAIRAETQLKVQEALNRMDPIDREVLALRHFELLSNGEVATVLGLSKAAASNRYVRALKRMKEISRRSQRGEKASRAGPKAIATGTEARQGRAMCDESGLATRSKFLPTSSWHGSGWVSSPRSLNSPSDIPTWPMRFMSSSLSCSRWKTCDKRWPRLRCQFMSRLALSRRRLGDYRVIREIGRGGMGVVYEAEQALTRSPGGASRCCRARAFRRCKASASIARHAQRPSCTTPTSFLSSESAAKAYVRYYVMQYIPGQPLDEVFYEVRRLRDRLAQAPGVDNGASVFSPRNPSVDRRARRIRCTRAGLCRPRSFPATLAAHHSRQNRPRPDRSAAEPLPARAGEPAATWLH